MDPKGFEDPKQFNERMKKADKQANFANENTKLINFVFIPFLSLLTCLFFKKSGYNYAENLILNILIGGQLVVWFVLICIIPVLIKPGLVIIVMYLFILASFAYAILAYKQFYQQKWGWTIFKGLSVQIIYLIVIGFISEYFVTYVI